MTDAEPVDTSVDTAEDALPSGRIWAVLIATLIIGGLLTWWVWKILEDVESELRPSGQFPEQRLGPPRERHAIEQSRFDDIAFRGRIQAGQRADLQRYGWVHRESGILRIPVERAFDLLLQRQEQADAPVEPEHQPAGSTQSSGSTP
jgi:hypothetical protein